MFIQTEDTPNPLTMKFLPGRTVMDSGTANFPDSDSADISPLARRLFDVAGVTGVFLGRDFISVTRSPENDWQMMKPVLLGVIMEHFVTGAPVMSVRMDEPESDEADSEVVAQIKELLDTRVRPAVAQDGGDIVFHSYRNGVVSLAMQGACHGCPSSTMTLKMGIENLLKHYIPDVVEVRPVL
ncbi:MAG: NifU family protein [bacterium]|nr:NifU family protein [bacterium]MDE0240869.1 NifU family protein [bacterium]MDE0415356.1 NifU family protein [bacterium]